MLILEEDVQGTITFIEQRLERLLRQSEGRARRCSVQEGQREDERDLRRNYKGFKAVNLYMIGVALINKFVNAVKETDDQWCRTSRIRT